MKIIIKSMSISFPLIFSSPVYFLFFSFSFSFSFSAPRLYVYMCCFGTDRKIYNLTAVLNFFVAPLPLLSFFHSFAVFSLRSLNITFAHVNCEACLCISMYGFYIVFVYTDVLSKIEIFSHPFKAGPVCHVFFFLGYFYSYVWER